MLLADRQSGPQPFVGVGRRQSDVDNDSVGRVIRDAYQQLIGGAAASSDFDTSAGQQLRDAFAQQHAVFGNGYPHGISARTRVPAPAALQIRSRPSRASTRSASPRRPV